MISKVAQKNIPKGWQRVKLGDIARLRKGLTYKSSHYSNEQDGMIFLTLKSIQRGGGFNTNGIKYYAGDFDANAVVKEGDLVIANTDITRDAEVVGAPMLLPKFQKEPVLISMDLSVLDADKKKTDNRFLYYFLQTPIARNFMRDHSSGSTVLHLKTKDVPKLDISIPSLSEQKNIAEILGLVDMDILKTDKIIDATEKLKKGLMQQLFTKGIGHTKFKKTKIGEIPEEWDVLELGEVCDVRDGTHSSPKYHEEGIPLVTSKNLVDSTLDFGNVGLISEIDHEEIEKRSKVSDGDILFGMIGTIGNPVIVKKDRDFAIKNVALIKFTKSEINNVFVLNFLKSPLTERQFQQKIGGSTQKFIALGVIRKILITVPSVAEQKRIAEILSVVDEKISFDKKIKVKLTILKKGLMQDLLSGKVRVNY